MDYFTRQSIGFQYVTEMLAPRSAIGVKLLGSLSLYAPSRISELEKEWDNVEKFAEALKRRRKSVERLETALMRIKDISGSLDSLGARLLDETELFEIKAFIAAASECRNAFEALEISDSGYEIHPLDEVYAMLGKGEGFYIDDSFSDRLAAVRKQKRETAAALKAAKGKRRDEIEKTFSSIAAEEYKITLDIIAELCEKLTPYGDLLKKNLLTLGKIDLTLQKAALAEKYSCAKPEIGDALRLDEAINPMVASAVELSGGKFSPISINAQSGVTVITGANMGGKTVALKTIALNCALAQTGFFVFAKSLVTPIFDDVESAALDAQNIERGLSSFAADVMRLDGLYRNSLSAKKLILIDEFASGTNAAEGAEIFRAAVKAFSSTRNTVIMTTHFDLVSDCASARYQVKGLSRSGDRLLNRDEGVKAIARLMDYGLIPIDPRMPIPRDAVKVCRLLGLHPDILKNIED